MKKTVKFRTTGLIAFALIFTLFTLSCRRASEKTGEKLMEKAIENATGQKADLDLSNEKAVIKTGDGSIEVDSKAKSWPDEIPGDVPEFTYGKVVAVTTSTMDGNKSWNIIYESVEDGFLDKYDADLKGKGFETVTMKMGDKGGSITADNNKYNVFLMGGEGKISVGVALKKEE